MFFVLSMFLEQTLDCRADPNETLQNHTIEPIIGVGYDTSVSKTTRLSSCSVRLNGRVLVGEDGVMLYLYFKLQILMTVNRIHVNMEGHVLMASITILVNVLMGTLVWTARQV